MPLWIHARTCTALKEIDLPAAAFSNYGRDYHTVISHCDIIPVVSMLSKAFGFTCASTAKFQLLKRGDPGCKAGDQLCADGREARKGSPGDRADPLEGEEGP